MCFQSSRKPRKEATEVSTGTLRRRVRTSEEYLKTQAGETSRSHNICESALIKRSTKESREEILKDLGVLHDHMDGAEGLAMIADLNMTWYSYRQWGK